MGVFVGLPYRYDGLGKCRKCGSYMPSYWEYCSRCGHPLHGRRRFGGWRWALLVLLFTAAFLSGGYLGRVFPDKFPAAIENRQDYRVRNGSGEAGAKDSVRLSESTPVPTAGTAEAFVPENAAPVSDGAESKTAAVQEETEPATPKPAGSKGADNTGNTGNAGKEFSGLTYEQKVEQIRSIVINALKNAEEQVTLPVLGTENDSKIVFRIIEKAVLDDPGIMFYEGARYRSDGLLTLKYSRDREFILSAMEATAKRADEIISSVIKPGMTDFEKELAIHDYIVNNCRYDIENLKKGATPPESYTAYGVLVKGKAVCEGYAKAMKLLLDRVGIPCLIVAGTSKGSSHAWNIVCLDGEYYHVDATWDDPVMADGSQVLSHVYFNLTDDEFRKDHSWDSGAYPACNAVTYNYYRYLGLAVNSPEELAAFIDAALDAGKDHVSVKVEDYDGGYYDIPAIIQQTAFARGTRNVYYSVNELYGVVDIWFR